MTDIINKITRRLGILPPDPDELNDVRAARAGAAIRAYAAQVDDYIFADLISDLKHWADRQPDLDIAAQLERAQRNYEIETGNEQHANH